MSGKNSLEAMGIKVIDKVEDLIIIEIANQVTTRLINTFTKCNLSYLDIYKALLDAPMYYAEIPAELSKANYNYKDSSLYFAEDIDVFDINQYVFHECIHKVQEKRDKKGKITRMGLCEVNELSVKATALNEGAIQYITAKSFDLPKRIVNIYGINIPSRTEYYPILTNIISQLVYLLGEEVLIDSTINGNEEFKIKIIDTIGETQYNYIEKSLNDILKTKDEILELKKANIISQMASSKIFENMNKIKAIYLEMQNVIYSSYFDDMLKRCENELEVSMTKKKLVGYKEFVGTAQNYNDFERYCADFERKAEQKVEKLKHKKSLMVVGNNFIFRIFRRIRQLFWKEKNEYYK